MCINVNQNEPTQYLSLDLSYSRVDWPQINLITKHEHIAGFGFDNYRSSQAKRM